jgi:hypothetical protein
VGSTADDLLQLDRFHKQVVAMAARRDGRGRPSFAIPRRRSSTDSELLRLDALSMKEWLDQSGYHAARFRWWIEYACRDDFGADLSQTCLGRAALFRVSSQPWRRRGVGFLTWPEGNGRLVDVMARRGRPYSNRKDGDGFTSKDDVRFVG